MQEQKVCWLHWDVETNSAVKLTTGSLKNLHNSESLSKALQKTKIEMMQSSNFSHPFWAPFVLIGNLNFKLNSNIDVRSPIEWFFIFFSILTIYEFSFCCL